MPAFFKTAVKLANINTCSPPICISATLRVIPLNFHTKRSLLTASSTLEVGPSLLSLCFKRLRERMSDRKLPAVESLHLQSPLMTDADSPGWDQEPGTQLRSPTGLPVSLLLPSMSASDGNPGAVPTPQIQAEWQGHMPLFEPSCLLAHSCDEPSAACVSPVSSQLGWVPMSEVILRHLQRLGSLKPQQQHLHWGPAQ